MTARSPHGKRVAWPAGQAGLPVSADWTGQILSPLEKFWWGESDLHSPLARLACPCSRSRYVAGRGSTRRNRFTIDMVR